MNALWIFLRFDHAHSPFINKQLCQPDLQFQPTVAPLVGQTKAIIISWIIMNIFLLLKRRFGFRWKIWQTDSCAKYPNSQRDMKPTAPESFFTIMNKRLPCLIMERFIVNHRDMWFFSSLVHFGAVWRHKLEHTFADWNFFRLGKHQCRMISCVMAMVGEEESHLTKLGQSENHRYRLESRHWLGPRRFFPTSKHKYS